MIHHPLCNPIHLPLPSMSHAIPEALRHVVRFEPRGSSGFAGSILWFCQTSATEPSYDAAQVSKKMNKSGGKGQVPRIYQYYKVVVLLGK
jgi:hypothetical protein